MIYSRAFFDLQWRFAQRRAVLSNQSLPQVLLTHTNFYVRFALGRGFDASNPVWLAFLSGLSDAEDPIEWTYDFYLERAELDAGPPVLGRFGCFSYQQLEGNRIRLHFQNAEGQSSLARDQQQARRGELRSLFRDVKRTVGPGDTVIGVSWLYNLEAYRRLFPASYVSNAKIVSNRFHGMPLWGQFLDRHGDLKPELTRPFLQCLADQADDTRMIACFPMQVLSVQAPVSDFVDFYDC